jgi:hypothetical protein
MSVGSAIKQKRREAKTFHFLRSFSQRRLKFLIKTQRSSNQILQYAIQNHRTINWGLTVVQVTKGEHNPDGHNHAARIYCVQLHRNLSRNCYKSWLC